MGCSSTTNHSKPRLMKLLLCCRLTRPSKWLQQLLQPSRRRNRARILNLKKKLKKMAKHEKSQTKRFFFFFNFNYARAPVIDDELAHNLLPSSSLFFLYFFLMFPFLLPDFF